MGTKKIDEKVVQYIAKLSRLSLPNKDIKRFSGQLSKVLDYVNKLNEVDTKDVSARSHAIDQAVNRFREDQVKKSLKTEEVLKNAPKKIDNFFIVPKIIE